MDASLTAGALQALGFALGTALCWLHASLRWKADRLTSSIWLAGSVWTLGSFARQVLLLAGVPPSRPLGIAALVGWTSACCTPALVSRLVDREMPNPSPVRGVLLGVSAFTAVALLILLFAAAFQSGFPLTVGSVAILSAYNFMLHAVSWGLIYRAHRRRRPVMKAASRGFPRIAVALICAQAVTILIAIYAPSSSGAAGIIGLVSQQMILPGAILTAGVLAKSRYADVALKRSLILVMSVVAATMVVWWLPGLQRGLPVVLISLLIAGLLLAAPACYRVLNRTVDRALLQRPDYRALARTFADRSRRTANREELFGLAERCARDALHMDAHLRAVSDGPTGAGVERIPVQGARSEAYALELTPTTKGRTLMQEEIAFLESVGAEVARRLEALEFERERRELQLREERLQHFLTQAELKALRAQVDPHFLFNTLNTIADLISRDSEKAESMTERLAAFFRYTLSRTERTMSTVDQELEFVRHYLEIEQVRFGERLRVELNGDPEAVGAMVPSLILQPLVENAIRHGLAPRPEGGSVSVSATCEGGLLQLQVIDDGVGIGHGRGQRGGGIGLRNVRERLRALYGGRAQMRIDCGAQGRGTSVKLLLPRV